MYKNSFSRTLIDFVTESNRIEGIHRLPTEVEMLAHRDFLLAESLTVADFCNLVAVLAPGMPLRDRKGRDVQVGRYVPPRGGPHIRLALTALLDEVNRTHRKSPHAVHVDYETLHPFMDGNGRSGRALWLWMMRGVAPLGFLHTFYYQTLAAGGQSK